MLLRVGLHVSFAFFLAFGLVETLLQGTNIPVLGLTGLTAALYLIGTTWEKRFVAGQRATTKPPKQFTIIWLISIIIFWIALVWPSSAFIWLLFPLTFLILNILPLPLNLVLLALCWTIAAFAPRDHWTPAAAIGPAIGIFFATAVYYSYQALSQEITKHALVAQELRSAQQELAESEHQAGRMEERERLSREIHDTVAQGLSSILLLCRAAQTHANNGNMSQVSAQLQTIHEQAQASLSEARRFVRDLASPDLSDPLPTAIRRVIARADSHDQALEIPREYTIEIVGEETQPIPEPIARTILRVTQEAISNVHKHSNATKVVVTLGIWDDVITLDVMDNGQVTTTPNDAGFGLVGLAQRVENIGGDFTIEFGINDGQAVALSCRIPLTSEGIENE